VCEERGKEEEPKRGGERRGRWVPIHIGEAGRPHEPKTSKHEHNNAKVDKKEKGTGIAGSESIHILF
jgi:hypothetical protein